MARSARAVYGLAREAPHPPFCIPEAAMVRPPASRALVASAFLLASAVATRAQSPQTLWSKPAHAGAVNAVAFSPDGQWIATAGDDHAVKLWRASDGAFVRTLATYFEEASSVSFSPDGALLASGSVDHTAHVTNVASGVTTCEFVATGFVRDVAFAPSGSKVALALGYFSNDFDMMSASGCELLSITKPNWGTIWTTAFSKNGAWVATGGADGNTVVMNGSTLQQVLTLADHENDVSAVVFDPSGSRVASSGLWDGKVLVWGVPGGSLLLSLSAPSESLHGVDISSDGSLIAASGEKWPEHGVIRIWRMADGAPVAAYASGTALNVPCVAFAPSASTFAFGRDDGTLTLAVTPGAFTPFGAGIAGSAGVPELAGSGDTTAGSPVGLTLSVSGAAPSAAGILLASHGVGSLPLLGGTLYAFPVVASAPLQADAAGASSLQVTLPADVPAGTDLVVQAWFLDASAPFGASATNGLAFAVK